MSLARSIVAHGPTCRTKTRDQVTEPGTGVEQSAPCKTVIVEPPLRAVIPRQGLEQIVRTVRIHALIVLLRPVPGPREVAVQHARYDTVQVHRPNSGPTHLELTRRMRGRPHDRLRRH